MIENKQEKIDKIYKEIANKELSFGCNVILHYNDDGDYGGRWGSKETVMIGETDTLDEDCIENYENYSNGTHDYYIIEGHPVMIGDVLDYITNLDKFNIEGNCLGKIYDIQSSLGNIILDWDLRKPIEEQSEETIDYIFNLL